jgi:hypothetical protein
MANFSREGHGGRRRAQDVRQGVDYRVDAVLRKIIGDPPRYILKLALMSATRGGVSRRTEDRYVARFAAATKTEACEKANAFVATYKAGLYVPTNAPVRRVFIDTVNRRASREWC